MPPDPETDRWIAVLQVSVSILAIAATVVVAWVGWTVTKSLKSRELTLQWVRTAIDILASRDPGVQPLRKWAADTVEKMAKGVQDLPPIPADVIRQLKRGEAFMPAQHPLVAEPGSHPEAAYTERWIYAVQEACEEVRRPELAQNPDSPGMLMAEVDGRRYSAYVDMPGLDEPRVKDEVLRKKAREVVQKLLDKIERKQDLDADKRMRDEARR